MSHCPHCADLIRMFELKMSEREGHLLALFTQELNRHKAENERVIKHVDSVLERLQNLVLENTELRAENERLRKEYDRPSEVNIVIPPTKTSIMPIGTGGWIKLIAVAIGAALAGFFGHYLH